ncbi:MAG: DUF559 domain-containing protein [Gemmataceae bacterium]
MANEFARFLRSNLTEAERFVWKRIRFCQLGGYRFRRQAPIGRFIVDFVCFQAKVVIELDGGQHAAQAEADGKRTAWLETQGFCVFRIWNHEVSENWDAIGDVLLALLCERASPPEPRQKRPTRCFRSDLPHEGEVISRVRS